MTPEEQQLQPAEKPEEEEVSLRKRNLYDKAKISNKALDTFIVVGIIALAIVMFMGLSDRGFDVEFNSLGGTDVPSQTLMYDEFLAEPEAPTREGYVFAGWYLDKDYTNPWKFDVNTVGGDIKLYAKWEPAA